MLQLEHFKEQRVLVTGGLGFIGSNLCHKLVQLGAEVTIYDACLDPYGWNFSNISEIKDKIRFVKADVRDMDALRSSLIDMDLVFHCAGQVSHLESMKNPFLDIDINCRGTIALLEVCRLVCPSAALIYAGTCGQTGVSKYLPIDENHPTDPYDIYGINKLASEKYFLLYNRAYGMKTCSLRLSYNYGPRQSVRKPDAGILNYFIRLALENKELTIYSPGTQLRDYNYVEDSIDAMILCSQNENAFGNVFLLGSGKPISLIDAAKRIVELTGSGSISMIDWPSDRKMIERGDYYASFEKIRSIVGWVPKTSFEDGLRKTIEFYKENLSKYI